MTEHSFQRLIRNQISFFDDAELSNNNLIKKITTSSFENGFLLVEEISLY